jgi:hypothetical protein
MPACARREIVRQGMPGIFHCWTRCVRRAFLLGIDPLTGNDYNHRRQWVVDRLHLLVSSFSIDVAFFGMMSNHLHLVLRTNPRLVQRMGDYEVARRWLRAYPGKRVLDGKWIEPTEKQVEALAQDKEKIQHIRRRLGNISWFMGALCEYIARRANFEEGCDVRFFSGRFSCREVTSRGALLVCGVYVDLNQVRAGEALTPESSRHCSVWFRIQAQPRIRAKRSASSDSDRWLAPLTLLPDHLGDVPSTTGFRASDKGLLDLSLNQYLRLLDWCGRQVRSGKRGAIPPDLAPILERLEIDPDEFLNTVEHFPRLFPRLAGKAEQILERARSVNRRWLHGVQPAAKAFPANQSN